MLLLATGLALCTASVFGLIPPSNVCYQHSNVDNACTYGNLSLAIVGRMLKPSECNSHINLRDIENPPYLYINSTNSTERFTIIMVDAGPLGRGPDYLHWMITNVSINTPNYQSLSTMNIVVGYEKPLLMKQPTLIQFLVFRHNNVLRVPFGELWVTRKRNFSLSTLFSNTIPNLRLCGPVAGTQFWVDDPSSLIPSAPSPPLIAPVAPVQPGYVPVAYVPVQPAYPVHPPPPGVGLPPSNQQHPATTVPKKSLATITQPMSILLVPLVSVIIFSLI